MVSCAKLLIISAMIGLTNVAIAAEQINIAVASNFLEPLKSLQVDFESQHGVKIRRISASTAKLYAQIKQGAPFDIFLSADKKTIERLVKEDNIRPDQHFLYAKGQLVFWSPSATNARQALIESHGRITLANPKLAPYGRAGWETLNRLTLLQIYEKKLIYTENVAQAFQHIFHGHVLGGFVALSQLKSKNIGNNYWVVPQEYYANLFQYGAVINRSDAAGVKKFVEYIQSAPVKRRLINEFGYAE